MRLEELNHELTRDRRVAVCTECNESREMAAHGLCFKCYRHHERQLKKPAVVATDFHNPGVKGHQKKLLASYTQLMKACGDLKIAESDLTDIRRVLDPYLLDVAGYVRLVDEQGARERRLAVVQGRLGVESEPVNSDLDARSPFTGATHGTRPEPADDPRGGRP